ncbi:phospholipase D-like domain-containing protein, partial [Mesorhizobium sp.]
ATAAQSRLVVMMPFIDVRGFEWLRNVFEAANANVEKLLVLRDVDQYAVDLSVHHGEWLRGMRIGIRDYCVAHGRGRALPLETFHAKIVLADDRLAYVGSANVLGSGDGTSLEAGVLVDGQAALQVARLIGGVLRIARVI